MTRSMITRAASLFAILLFAAACTTSNSVQTANPAGNYTANVKPYGSSGR